MRILSVIALLVILCGCSGGQKADRAAIAVSFEPQAWMLRQITGDDYDIITLLPAGSDPETYQPSISTMKSIGDAEAFFTLGTPGFEKSLLGSLSSNFPNLKIIDFAHGIDKITETHGHSHETNDHVEDEVFDPHILSSIRNCSLIADKMTDILVALAPDKAEKYREGGERLKTRLKAMDDSIAQMNIKGKSIVIRHPSLSYFARDYGIEQLTLQDDGKETSPLQMKKRINEAEQKEPAVFVLEKEHASPSDAETAKQLGVKMIEVSLNSSDWLDDLMRLSKEIALQ